MFHSNLCHCEQVGPPGMLDNHKNLIELRKTQKDLEASAVLGAFKVI